MVHAKIKGLFWLASLSCVFGGALQSERALAHMSLVGLEHFVTQVRPFVALVTSLDAARMASALQTARVSAQSAEPLGVFELGGNKRVHVFGGHGFSLGSLQDADVVRFDISPGEMLAFVETNESFVGRAVTGTHRSGDRVLGLFVLSPAAHRQLVANPRNLVHAVPLQFNAEGDGASSRAQTSLRASLSASDLAFFEGPYRRALAHGVGTSVREARPSPVKQERLLEDVRILSGEKPFRDAEAGGAEKLITERGTAEARDLTRRFLLQSFRAAGAEAEEWCYRGSQSGCNVLAKIVRPSATRTVVISSHLDSVRNAGADDNASGTAALLELARLYSQDAVNLNVAFVAFDQEELGLIGSSRMARAIAGLLPGKFIGNINTDMIAYDSDDDGALHVIDCGRKDSLWLSETARAAVTAWGLPLEVRPDCTNRSDHASFWKEGLPAMLLSENFFGGDSNRCYHQKCDRVDLINEVYYTNMVTLLHGTVRLASETMTQAQAPANLSRAARTYRVKTVIQ